MPEFLASLAASSQNVGQNTPVVPGILNVLMSGMIFGCVVCWIFASIRLRNGNPLIRWQARDCVPWNLVDAFVAVILQLTFIFAGAKLFTMAAGLDFSAMESESLTASQQISLMVFGEVSMLIAVGLTIAYLKLRSRVTPFDLGLPMTTIGRDILLGVLAFFMLMMPVLLMQVGLEKLFPSAGNHPFVDLLREQGNDYMLALIFLMAVIIAPIVEEFLFRVVIQGWLERLMASQVATGPLPDSQEIITVEEVAEDDPTVETDGRADQLSDGPNPDVSAQKSLYHAKVNPLTSRDRISQVAATASWQAWIPIVIASALFAGAHFGHGTAPIPLFFLSLGLGYVYHRTHRIWPSLVTHALVNLLAVVQLKIAMDNGMPV